jgi:hypothetical protein
MQQGAALPADPPTVDEIVAVMVRRAVAATGGACAR